MNLSCRLGGADKRKSKQDFCEKCFGSQYFAVNLIFFIFAVKNEPSANYSARELFSCSFKENQ